ncbi:MAG: type II toxin-antitoxin system prevent-host-death family antitoxin [Nitrospirae bacterium]|nr:type II toxin-antitoxin system prevent-host-death family antitoxin [Nitrospirota bacterium]
MKTLTATQARSDFFNVIKKAVKGHRQFRISSKQGGVIVLSEEDYESLLETLELLSTPGVLKGVKKAKQEIKKGKTFSMEEIFGG